MTVSRILIAEVEESFPIMRSALLGYELLQTTHVLEAERLCLEDGIDLFIVGVHFDDSKALELIRFIRANKNHKNTPIVVQRLQVSQHTAVLRQTFEVMCSAHVIKEYVELEGDPLCGQKIRATVEKYLPAENLAKSP